jgi:hypothetical protein
VPTLAKGLGVPPALLHELAATGVEQTLEVMGDVDPVHAGWAIMLTGISITRNARALSPPLKGKRADNSFVMGVIATGLITALAGDSLISSAAAAGAPEWAPGPKALEARRLAEQISDGLLDLVASPESRAQFTTQALAEVATGLPGLDWHSSGWTELAFGDWLASSAEVIARSTSGHRRAYRRHGLSGTQRAKLGGSFVAALVAEIGLAMVAGPPQPKNTSTSS